MTILGKKIAADAIALGVALAITPRAVADTDTTPPSVPQNLRDASLVQSGNPVLVWDASSDTCSGVSDYWVIVDGQQRARPRATTYDIQTLLNLGRITKGPHTITVQ